MGKVNFKLNKSRCDSIMAPEIKKGTIFSGALDSNNHSYFIKGADRDETILCLKTGDCWRQNDRRITDYVELDAEILLKPVR